MGMRLLVVGGLVIAVAQEVRVDPMDINYYLAAAVVIGAGVLGKVFDLIVPSSVRSRGSDRIEAAIKELTEVVKRNERHGRVAAAAAEREDAKGRRLVFCHADEASKETVREVNDHTTSAVRRLEDRLK